MNVFKNQKLALKTDIEGIQQERDEANELVVELLLEVTSLSPKIEYLFSKPDIIPNMQIRMYRQLQKIQEADQIEGLPEEQQAMLRKLNGDSSGLPKTLREMQHSIAQYIDQALDRYSMDDVKLPPLTQMKTFFTELRIIKTDTGNEEGKIFSGLQESVMLVSGEKILRAAEAEYKVNCESSTKAFDFLNLLDATEMFRKLKLKEKILERTTVHFS